MGIECTPQEAITPHLIVREALKLLIGTVLLMIYVRLIYVLITRKHMFYNVFYKLVTINGIFACFCYLSYAVVDKFVIIVYLLGIDVDSITGYSKFSGFFLFVWYYATLAGSIGTISACLNRLTSIVGIKNIDWKKLYYYILAVYFIVPFVLFFQLFGRRSSIIAVCYPDFPYLNNIVLETEEVNDLLLNHDTVALVTDVGFLFLGALINIITLVGFWRQGKAGANTKKTVHVYAKNLLLISLGEFLCHMSLSTADILFYIYYIPDIDTEFMDRPYAITMQLIEFTPILPGLLIAIISKSIRIEMMSFLKKAPSNGNQVVLQVISRHDMDVRKTQRIVL